MYYLSYSKKNVGLLYYNIMRELRSVLFVVLYWIGYVCIIYGTVQFYHDSIFDDFVYLSKPYTQRQTLSECLAGQQFREK